MEAWVQTDEGLACEAEGLTVRLIGARGQPVCCGETDERVELQEWAEYLVRADEGAPLQVYQDRIPAERLEPDLWRVSYQNHIGLSTLWVVLARRRGVTFAGSGG